MDERGKRDAKMGCGVGGRMKQMTDGTLGSRQFGRGMLPSLALFLFLFCQGLGGFNWVGRLLAC
jgi:hypothetical protein